MSGLRVVLVLAAKDLRLLTRDWVALFFTLAFPLLFAMLFGAVFSGSASGRGPRAIPVAVVVLDDSPDAHAIVAAFTADERLAVRPIGTVDEARNLVRTGKADAFILVPEGLGRAARDPFAGEPMRLEVGSAPSGRSARSMLEGIATQALYQHLQASMLEPDRAAEIVGRARERLEGADGVDPARRLALQGLLVAADRAIADMPEAGAGDGAAFELVRIEQVEVAAVTRGGSANAYAISFPQAMLWGVMGCAAVFGVSLVSERTGGTMTRLRVAPIGRWHIVLGKAAACLCATLLVCVAMLVVAWLGFGVRPVSPLALAVAVFAVAWCFVGVMMLLAVAARTEAAANGIGWACLLTLAMIGGGAIPLVFMPPWLRQVANVSPVKWGIFAIEGGLWRGLTAAEMATPVGLLVVTGCAAFAVGALVFARRESR